MRRWFAGAALLLCACAGDLASPFSAVAVTYDVNQKSFKLAQVRVNTLTSLRHLQGSAGQVKAGGAVRVSKSALRAGATVDSLRASFVTAQPAQVQIAWSVLNDIVYPENFDSLELLSDYYNLEKARTALANWGSTTLPARLAVAHADIKDDSGLSPLADGELYYTPLATFYLPAATPRAQIPASFNVGAVAHALAHEAVEEQIWKGAPLAAPELGPDHDPLWNSARHIARSLAEGIADYLGVAVSEDPRWFDHSLQQGAATRALDTIRCSSPDMLEALPADDAQTPYDPYPLGTVLAGALWESSQSGVQLSAKGVLAALPDLGQRALAAQGKLTIGAILDALVLNADPQRKADLCGLFYNRFAKLSVKSGDLPACAQVTPVDHPECQ
jgi:hypothetical protein